MEAQNRLGKKASIPKQSFQRRASRCRGHRCGVAGATRRACLKTFLDSGILLTAWKGKDRLAAIAVMEDGSRQFYTSELVKLELLPKATFHRQKEEANFYRVHFDRCRSETAMTSALCHFAYDLAAGYGLAAMDALHVAAAIRQGVEEFITTELPGKPLFRVEELRIVSLHQLRNVP